MEESKKGKSLEEIQNQLGQYMITSVLILFVIQIGLFIVQYGLGFSKFMLVVIFGVLPILAFVMMKDKATEAQVKLGIIVSKLSLALFGIMIANHAITVLIYKVGTDIAGGLFRLRFLVTIFMMIAMLVFLKSKKIESVFESMKEKSFFDSFNLFKSKENEEIKPGDAILCTNMKTKKKVIWKFKDRFLHMLILGPTGSGKTSQTIIPLINQDMQNKEAGITVIEPKGDLAEKVYAMAKHYGREAIYFNPVLPDCPYFNPLFGKEEVVLENMSTTFKMLNADSQQYFLDMNDNLLKNAIKVLKRMYGNKANMIELHRLVQNSAGVGKKMVQEFSRLPTETAEKAKENADIASWFLTDYFAERSKNYENTSGIRSQLSKITSNVHLRRVLNPPNGENDIDFEKHLEEGGVITVSIAQGDLQDLGQYLGYFIILQFQSAVFKRPGTEKTRRAHYLYIDEFQVFANSGFANMLTQGRSYRVASHLATQNRALIGMNAGKDAKNFVELVSTNARNVVIYPGGNAIDADYYSKQFGQEMRSTTQIGITRQKFNPLKGIKPMSYDSESIRDVEKLEFKFTPTDIIYRKFKEIVYCLIEDNSVGEPGIGMIDFIPEELNNKLDQMVDDFNAEQENKMNNPRSTLESKVENAPENVEKVVNDEVVMRSSPSSIEDPLGDQGPSLKNGFGETIRGNSNDEDLTLVQQNETIGAEEDILEDAMHHTRQKFTLSNFDEIEEDELI